MPKLCANLTLLYNEVPFLERFRASAQSGFKGVEYLFPYAYPCELLAELLSDNGLVQVLHNLPAGDWERGERGIGCLPDRVGEFQDSVGRAIEYATALGCKQVNCLAGIAPASVPRERAEQTFIDNLKFAAPRFKSAGIKLLIEAINTRDMPGVFSHEHAPVARSDRQGGLGQSVRAVRHLSHADHGGRSRPHDRGESADDSAHAARGQSRAQRARDRRDQLCVPARLHRPLRIRRVDRVRIQTEDDDARIAGVGRAVAGIGLSFQRPLSPARRARAGACSERASQEGARSW